MSALDAVRAAYERGWSVIPCGADRKARVRWQSYQHERPSPEQLECWLRTDPPCWAVITGALSGIVALDFTQNGDQRWRNGVPANVRTPRGGSHVYVAHPGHKVATLNEHSKRELGACFPGTDVRGDGGYAVFAGRSQFGEYELRSFEPVPANTLPVGLRSLVDGHFDLIVQALGRVNGGSGGRNDVGFWLAGQLRDARLPQAEVKALVHVYANAAPSGDHPYTADEVRDSVASAFSEAPRDPPSSNGAVPTGWLDGEPMDPCAESTTSLPALAGFPFLHRGMAAVVSGPTGGGRSMLVEACSYDAARAGLRVGYLGGEVTAEEFNARAKLIADKRADEPEQVRADLERVRWLELDETLARAWSRPKTWIEEVARRYQILIVDPLNDALAATGHKHENADYVSFYQRLIKPLRGHGVAVVMLDNVGHADDAQDRPLGPSSKGHKADLMFTAWVHEEPLALRLQATKVRSIRAAFEKGATWECDEATLTTNRIEDASRTKGKGRQERERDGRLVALGAALTEKPQTVRALADATKIPKSTVQRLLEDADWAEQIDGGWILSHVPFPSDWDSGTTGQDDEEGSA